MIRSPSSVEFFQSFYARRRAQNINFQKKYVSAHFGTFHHTCSQCPRGDNSKTHVLVKIVTLLHKTREYMSILRALVLLSNQCVHHTRLVGNHTRNDLFRECFRHFQEQIVNKLILIYILFFLISITKLLFCIL